MKAKGNETRGINRRDFLKGAVSVGAISLAGGLAACSSPASGTSNGGDSAASASSSTHAWEVTPATIPAGDIKETVDADIVVIGAGTAGLIAAHSAAEAGAKVVLIEKMETFSARGHDVAAVGSKFQESKGVVIDKLEMKKYWSQIMGNKTDMALFNIWLNKSGEVMDYYVDKMAAAGVECFIGSLGTSQFSTNPCLKEYPTAHQFGKGQKTEDGEYTHHLFIRYVEGWAKELGVDIRYNTKAEQLVKDAEGKVIGVIAKGESGYIQFNGPKGVILATGGIAGNDDMLKLWAPLAYACPAKVYIPLGANTGDGLCMGIWAGGAHQKTSAAPMFLPSSAAAGGPLSNDGGNLCWLAVNTNGERFAQEDVNGTLQSFAIAKQPGAIGYSIFDANYPTDILKHVEKGLDRAGAPYVNDKLEGKIADATEQKLFFKADTLDELATAIGADTATLKKTVERYNAQCAAAADEDFGKEAKYLTPVATAPFYASRIRCALLTTPYGLNVNSHSQVCSEDDEPIANLYAIGNVQGNFFSDGYPILCPGISHGRGVTFGRVLGQALAKGEQI